MDQSIFGFCMTRSAIFWFLAAALCTGTVSAAQPVKLGYAETVIGGQLVLVEEACRLHGLGNGYVLYLTNPRGTTIGKGCAMANALPSNLGMILVQWDASFVQGAESYPLDGFTWTSRGLTVMAPVLKARQEAIASIKAEKAAQANEETENLAMVAAFNNADAQKPYLGVIRATAYPPTILIIPRQCSMLLSEPDPSGRYSAVMVRKNNGRTALGLSSSGSKVVDKGCALSNGNGSITLRLSTDSPERPKQFSAEQVRWEPKGQEWIEPGASKGN